MAAEAARAFAARRRVIERALRAHPDPAAVVVVVLPREDAARLRRGLAVERLALRDVGEGVGELVALERRGEPPRLFGWSPVGRRGG